MKKLLSIVLSIAMLLCMFTVAVAAEDAAAPVSDPQVLREYDRASAGDILFLANFNSESYVKTSLAETNVEYTPSEDGLSIDIKGVEDTDPGKHYFGAAFEQLEVPKDAKVTLIFKVKVNGEVGQDNSIGIGGWFVDDYSDVENWVFFNEYGNWNSAFEDEDGTNKNRSAFAVSSNKNHDYTNTIDAAPSDDDGFITAKIEFDGKIKMMYSYYLDGNNWVKNNEAKMTNKEGNLINNAKKNDHLGVGFYTYRPVVDVTVKDLKWFKGHDLTIDQLSITKNTTEEITPTEATTRAYPTLAPETEAPATQAPVATTTGAEATTAAPAAEGGCGGMITASAIAMIPVLAGAAFVFKKKED